MGRISPPGVTGKNTFCQTFSHLKLFIYFLSSFLFYFHFIFLISNQLKLHQQDSPNLHTINVDDTTIPGLSNLTPTVPSTFNSGKTVSPFNQPPVEVNLDKKILNCAWHPHDNLIAVADRTGVGLFHIPSWLFFSDYFRYTWEVRFQVLVHHNSGMKPTCSWTCLLRKNSRNIWICVLNIFHIIWHILFVELPCLSMNYYAS